MRIVVCDDDVLMREMVESLIAATGHEVVGVADDTASAVGLVAAARPDAVILDVSLGFNTDFDIIEAALATGARPIVFTRNVDAEVLGQHPVTPTVVPKPDLGALEQVLLRLERGEGDEEVIDEDRRRRPTRAAQGPQPTGPSDAAAFFEAINAAEPGDALVGLDVPAGAESVAIEVGYHLRATDRVLLILPRAVRVFLPGGGDEGVASVLGRIRELALVTSECQAASVVVQGGEVGADAFDRLRKSGELHPL